MSKKLVAILAIVMFLAFTFAANAGDEDEYEHITGSTSKDIYSGNKESCFVAGYLVGGLTEVFMCASGAGSIISPIGGALVGGAAGYACEEVLNWLDDDQAADTQAKTLCAVGSRVYFTHRSIDGVGKVTSIGTILNEILVKSDGDGVTYRIGYGWNSSDWQGVTAFATYKKIEKEKK